MPLSIHFGLYCLALGFTLLANDYIAPGEHASVGRALTALSWWLIGVAQAGYYFGRYRSRGSCVEG